MGRTNKKKIAISVMLSVFALTIMMFVGLTVSASKAGRVANADVEHTHDGITFTAWESTTSLPTSAGNYYLTADVTIGSTWSVPAGTTNLCLNGHGIKMTGNDSVVYVASGNTLNLYDEEGANVLHYFDVDSDSCATDINDVSGDNSFYGGYVAGGKGRNLLHGGGIFIDGGTFNLYGGNIIGNKVTASDNCGAGVFLNDNSTFRMYGGSISYNYAQNAGCAFFGWHNSTIELHGGEISHNKTAWSHGSAFSFWNQGGYTVSLKWYGGEIHDNLTGSGGGAVNLSESSLTVGMKGAPTVWNNSTSSSNSNATLNVHVGNNPINIEGALTNTKKIGIRLGSGTGVFTNGWSTYMGDADPAEYFYSEDENYSVYLQDGEAAILAEPPVQRHTHDGITFEAWESTTSLPSTAGNYYLTADVTIGSTWSVPSGTTNLCLNGHVIAAASNVNISVITVKSNSTLNLYDCDTTTHYYYVNANTYKQNRAPARDKLYDIGEIAADGPSDSDYVASTKKGTFVGGYITGGTGQGLTTDGNNISGGGFQIYGGGTLNMYGGCIFGNYTSATSSAGNGGGGVYIYENGVFNMNGGYIIGNQGGNSAGGVENLGTFIMNGGYIRHNTAGDGGWASGGGVNNIGTGTMTMNGGVIEGNEACGRNSLGGKSGGGINNGGSLTINGGSVINNFSGIRGGGICVSSGASASLTIGANAKITGNYNKTTEKADDVYLDTDKKITLGSALTEKNPVSVTLRSGTGVFTSGWSTYMGDADPADYFTSNDYCLTSSNGEGSISEHTYNDNAHSSEYYTCSVCGHVDTDRQASLHDFDTENWTYDGVSHWHNCLYDGCEEREDEAAHSFGDDPNSTEYYTCSVCGYTDTDRQVTYVETVIDKIPDPIQYTPECEDAINTARNEYDSIPEDKKEGVDNRQKLFDAEKTYANLRDFQWTIKITPKATVPSDYAAYVAEGEKIVRLCDVTLYRIARSGDQANVPVKAQPSDIGKNFIVSVKLTVPDTIIGKNFRVLHVHAADDYEFVEFTTAENGEYIIIDNVDRLSDFAFVAMESDITPSDQGDVPTDNSEKEITKEDDPTIDNWELTPQGGTEGVTVALEDTDSQTDIFIEVDLKTEISEEVKETQNSVLNSLIKSRDEIAVVYEVKLIRTTVINGVETREEIQPSDIKLGTVVVINMSIPENLRGRSFKLLHIHADQEIKEISYTVSEDGTIATVRVDSLSEFVFVRKGLSVWAIIGIVIGVLLFILLLLLLLLFLLKRKKKEKETVYVYDGAGNAAGALAATAVADSDEAADDGIVVYSKGNYFNIRYNKSFTAKLIQSSDETKGYYGELKNEVLSYTKTKSHVSWAYDSVNAGREHIVKFSIRGKTLCIYLPLNVEELDEKYKVEKVEAAKYAAVPCLYRIKNERRLRYAKELIEKVCLSMGLAKGEAKNEDYYLPYETNEPLIARGLIKELTVKATDTQIERAKKEGSIRIVDNVSASDANVMIDNEVALAAIIKTGQRAKGKKGIINVDTLSLNFNDGDTVTVQGLKEKKLIAPDVKQVKLLARGNLDKVLHIELQDYSIEAVKMIIATGGTVKSC